MHAVTNYGIQMPQHLPTESAVQLTCCTCPELQRRSVLAKPYVPYERKL